MKIISAQEESAPTCEKDRRHLICPANNPDFKPRKLIIPPVGTSAAKDDDDNDDDDTLVS